MKSPECVRIELPSLEIGYSAAAAWSRDWETLWIADSLAGELIAVGVDGHVEERIARPGLGRFEFERPAFIARTKEGFVLKNAMSHLIWFDDELKPQRALDFRNSSRSRDFAGDIYLIDQVIDDAEGELIGYGFIRESSEARPWRGFLRLGIQLGKVVVEEKILQLPGTSNEARFSNLVLPSLAPAKGAVWGLRLSQPPEIVRLDVSGAVLRAFPSGFESLPSLPATTPTNHRVRQAVIERSALPVALHGIPDHLFLLTRRPLPNALTRWQLHQIDPIKDVLLRSIEIPTTAQHLVLAPGETWWAVLEKAQTSSSGSQSIPSMLLLPAEAVVDPDLGGDVLLASCP